MNNQRRARRAFALLLITAATLAATIALSASPAHAATITVNTTVDELNTDGDCSLREAIEAANLNAPVDACPAGQPSPVMDVINFSVTGTIALNCCRLFAHDDLSIDGPGEANLTISGGFLEVSGGVVVNLHGVTLADGRFTTIWNHGTLTITSSTLSGNSAGGFGGRAGAIYNSAAPNATLTIIDSTLSGNSAGSFGGAIDNDGRLTISNSTFSGNSAGSSGGAIVNRDRLTVTDSTFSSNSAEHGGAISAGIGTMTVTNTTFSENTAVRSGGAISNIGSLTVSNSTFSENSAVISGGAINNLIGTVLIGSSTFTGNSATTGGAIENFRILSMLTLRNTIIANSTSGGNCSGPITSAGHNLDGDNTCGLDSDPSNPDITDGDWINTDPLLGPLADNGGPTQTHALQPESPAIDAASPDCPPPATDQRGVNRPQGAACDIGAFELEADREPCPSPPSGPDESNVFVSSFAPKESHKFTLSEDPEQKQEKVGVEAGIRGRNSRPADIAVCLTLHDLPPECTGRWRVVLAEAPARFDRTDGDNDGVPDTLIFTLDGVPVAPTVVFEGGPDKPVFVGPESGAGTVIDLHWQLNNVRRGEKVKVEPYMRYACNAPGEYSYQFDVQTTPVGRTDPDPSDNTATGTTTLTIEAP